MITAEGYTKFTKISTGAKWYRANLANVKNLRYSRRKFRTAMEAEDYGLRLAERWNRMSQKAVEHEAAA